MHIRHFCLLIAGSLIPAAGATLFSDNFSADSTGLAKVTLVNWNVLDGTNVDVGGFSFGGCVGACVDMDGSSGRSNGDIETKQSFNFLAGVHYTLSFTLGNNSFGGNTLRVRIGSLVDQTLNAPSTNPGFVETLMFKPTQSQNAKIRFTSGGPADNGGAALDNVALTSAPIPEPSTWLAVSAALAALGLYRRRPSR